MVEKLDSVALTTCGHCCCEFTAIREPQTMTFIKWPFHEMLKELDAAVYCSRNIPASSRIY